MVRKGGLEPPCLSAPPPQDGVSANFTTSALKNRFIFNYLMSTPLSASVRCIHFCHYLLQPTIGKKLSASQIRQTGKQGVDSVRLRMDVTHRRFDVIVPRCVLQCERVRILPGLGQKCVPQSVQSCVRVGLDFVDSLVNVRDSLRM
jgi:hypothetical protein